MWYSKRLVFVLIFFTFISCLSQGAAPATAELPFQGVWYGEGVSLVNGSYQSIEITLRIEGEQVLRETIRGGFIAVSLDYYRSQDDGTYLWEDSKDRKIGIGDCQDNLCTFTGTYTSDTTVYTYNNVYHLSGDKLFVSESVSSADSLIISNLKLKQEHTPISDIRYQR